MKRKRDLWDGPRTTPGMGAIQLDPGEKRLKELLLDVASSIGSHRAGQQVRNGVTGEGDDQVVLRWAGGWVRDKLLGIKSSDIDVAINSMTGEAFGAKLMEFCESKENRVKHSLSSEDIGNKHTVEANPDKSKHLETVTIKILDLDVDFVNLRKEEYAKNSRIPTIGFGTAEEDVLRRDATINALFYNLHTGEVEDLTKRGLKDLENKIIRTPLEPLETFTDDPLRVLRLVRFASRLGFTIEKTVEETMSEPEVLKALSEKVSRERVLLELEKMLKNKNAADSLQLIDRLGLYHAVFSDPTRSDLPTADISRWRQAYEGLRHLSENRTPGSIYQVLARTEEELYFAWMLTTILPYMALASPEVHCKGTRTLPLPTVIAQSAIKASTRLSDMITATCRNRGDIEALKKEVCEGSSRLQERDRFGMAVRAWDTRTGNWRPQVLALCLLDVMQNSKPGSPESRDDILAGWQKFLDHLEELDVMDAPKEKPPINGNELKQKLGVKKAGPWMARAMDVCMAWRLRNPGVTDTQGAVDEVRRRAAELGIEGIPESK